MSYDSSPDTRQKYTRNCAHSLLKVCPSFSTLAFSRAIVFFVRHFQVVHFQRHRSLSVRLSQAGIVSKRLDESSWFWHGGFLPPIPHCVIRKFGYLQNKGTWLWNTVTNSGLRKFLHLKSIVLSTKLVDGWACWRHMRPSTHVNSSCCGLRTICSDSCAWDYDCSSRASCVETTLEQGST